MIVAFVVGGIITILLFIVAVYIGVTWGWHGLQESFWLLCVTGLIYATFEALAGYDELEYLRPTWKRISFDEDYIICECLGYRES